MSHPSLFPTTRPAVVEPSPTFQGAAGYLETLEKPSLITRASLMNDLIDAYCSGEIDRNGFVTSLNGLGLSERAKAALLAVPVYRYAAKSDELQHEYEVCPDCLQVDGNHTEDCMG